MLPKQGEKGTKFIMKGKKITIITSIIMIALIIVSLFTKRISNTIISSNSEQQKNATYNSLETYAANSVTTYSIEWQKSIGSDYVTEFKSAVKTSDGGIIAVGSTDINTFIEGENKKSYGNQDGIIVKYSYDGTVEWSKLLGGRGNDELFKVESKPNKSGKPDEEVYVVGGYVDSGEVKYDDVKLEISDHGNEITDYGYMAGIIMTIDRYGNIKWVKTLEGTGKVRINAVTINENGDVGVTGSYYSSITVNGTKETLTSSGEKDGFICVFSNDGNYKWSKNLDSNGNVTGKAITATSKGFAVGVNFKGELTIGEENKGDNKVKTKGKVDAVVIKFSSAGDVSWKKQLGSTDNDEVYDITANAGASEIIVVGALGKYIAEANISSKKYYDGMLVKLYESSGTVKQAISIGGYDNGVIDSVVPTNNGGVLLGGWTYSKDVKYNNVSITSSNKGKNEGLIIELNAYNNLVWSDVIQGELYDCINDIVYMGDGSYYAVGDFNSKSITNGNENIKKKVQEDDVLLKNNASYSSDAFVIKYITNTYVPPKKQEGKVTVHHVIEEEYKEWEDDFKKEIKEALNGELEEKPGEVIEIRKGKIGDPYKVEEKDIEHYKLNSAIENAEGTYAEENTDIYVYYVPKDYKYKIEYYYDGEFDSNSTETKEAKYNSTVTVSPSKEKDGYKLVNITSENGENYSNENEVQLKISDDPEKNVIKFYYENTEFKTITVKKVWEMSDEEAENYRATIQLMRVKDGEKTPLLDKEEHEFKVEIIGNRSGTIKNVPVNKGGEPIEYALKEIKVEKRKSPNENNWEEVSLTQFDVSYQIVKGDENN